jgi:integrase
MKDAAVRTITLGSIDTNKMIVIQDPKKGVNVKFSKAIYSKIFPFDKELIDIIRQWIEYLRNRGFGDLDPLFPKSKSIKSDEGFSYEIASGVTNEFWSSSVSIRTIFKEAARRSKLNYFQPHTFRHASMHRALLLAKGGLELKAISQNFGHEDVATTLTYYANFSPNELFEVLEKINFNHFSLDLSSIEIKRKLEELIRELH